MKQSIFSPALMTLALAMALILPAGTFCQSAILTNCHQESPANPSDEMARFTLPSSYAEVELLPTQFDHVLFIQETILSDEGIQRIRILDQKGNQVMALNSFGLNEFCLKTGDLPTGKYYIQLKTSDGVFTIPAAKGLHKKEQPAKAIAADVIAAKMP